MSPAAKPRRCVLDCAGLASVAAVYDALARQLDLPAHFGRNLDALWDCLTADVQGPVEIVLRNRCVAPPAMRDFLRRLDNLLHEAAAKRTDLTVIEE